MCQHSVYQLSDLDVFNKHLIGLLAKDIHFLSQEINRNQNPCEGLHKNT